MFLGNALISWRSKKQNIVSRSSEEAEYISMATTICEVTWLLYLLRDLHVPHHKPMLLYCDNQVALHISANPIFHERSKHFEVDCHKVRNKLGVINIFSHHIQYPDSSKEAEVHSVLPSCVAQSAPHHQGRV